MLPDTASGDVPKDQLRQACAELERRLTASEDCRAEEFLTALPALASSTAAALEIIYTEFIVRARLGQRPAPEDWYARFPQWRQDLRQLFQVHEYMGGPGLTSAGATVPDKADRPAAPDCSPRRLGNYELLEELGRGGMGVVYRARQAGLDRVVAVKVILAGEHAGPEEVARFRTEAKAAARLQHPNVVQIHEVEEQDGRPYLALEYVDGGSLHKKLAGGPLPPRQAAELVEALARAMHYAHQRGVIHRDLKPANVLLTADGVPKVSDFGLAKRLREAEGATTAGRTPTGAVLGTPSYMPPEQAWGMPGEVGPAADVYALGAILYEALTGRPPFQAASVLEVLEQVWSQEPVAPTRLQPRLPRDLETVCLKCLEKEPVRRYASAEALAEDLRRYLAGEPVQARPMSAWRRGLKWARRRPAAAALLALGLAAGLSLAVATLLLLAANRRETEARSRAEQAETAERQQRQEIKAQRDRAETNFKRTLEAVNRYFTAVSENDELRAHGLEGLRLKLLLTAKRYYEEFVKERGDDPELRAEQAKAYGRLAQITAEIGSRSDAVKLYQKAVAILEPLGDDPSGSPAHADALARLHNNLGLLYQAIGATGEAETAYRQVLRLRKALVRGQDAQVAAHRAGLADGYTNLGNLYFARGRMGEAEPAYNQAHDLRIALVKEHGKVTEHRAQLATSYHNLGGLYQATGRLKAAEEAYQEGLKVCLLLCKISQDPGPQSQLALSHSNLGTLYSATDRPKLAEKAHQTALEKWRQLAAKHPLVTTYHFGVARSTLNLGRVYSRTERLKEAEGSYGEALLTLERLDKEHPLVHKNKYLLSEVHNHLGGLNRARGRPCEAEAEYRRALDIRKELAAKHPKLFRFARGAGEVAYNLGLVLLRDRHDAGAALKCFAPAVDYLQEAFSQGGPHSGARTTLCKALGHRAIALTRLERYAEALRDWDQALGLDDGRLGFPMLISRAETLKKARQEAVEFARSGEHARAAALAQALAAQRSLSAEFFYQVAAVYALAFAAARKDVARPAAERDKLAKEYATRALELLKRANAAGYFKAPANLAKLKHDPDFDTLRPRDDFRRLLSAAEGKSGDAPPGRGPKR
jgi:eukaryotic-like serine/threonine-protein kinase